MKKISIIFIVCFAISSTIFAGGFQTTTQNARAMAMGGAFTGLALDASSIYYNPAGLSNITGFNLVAGTTLISPSVTFTGPTPLTSQTETVAKTFTPINLYAAYTMDNGVTLGVGVYNPYGLGSEWPSGWIGKGIALKTELRTFYVNPTVAYKVSNELSVGVGFSFVISDVQFSRQFDLPPIPVSATVTLPAASNVLINLDGDGNPAFNINAGILFKPSEDFSFGVSYRGQSEIAFRGDVTFEGLPTATHSALFPAGKGSATITMPWDLRAGVSYNVTKNLTINTDVIYINWKTYKSLDVDFDNNTTLWKDSKAVKNWENVWSFRFGGEYRINALALRAGYVRDGNPIPGKYMDPSLPGNDRNEITAGVGYQITKNFRVDAAYQFISFSNEIGDSALPFNGKYENSTNLFGFNIAYSIQ